MGACSSVGRGPKEDLFAAITSADGPAKPAAIMQDHPELASLAVLPQRRTVWHTAADCGNIEALRAMAAVVRAKQVPSDASNEQNEEVQGGSVHPIIKEAIDSADMGGATALMLACQAGHSEVVTWLLDQGADPWVADRFLGRGALHVAALKDQAGCIRALLSHPGTQQEGTSLSGKPTRLADAPTRSGYTPLHYAASTLAARAAAALLQHSAYPCAKNWSEGHEWFAQPPGTTPLHMAAVKANSLAFCTAVLKHYHDYMLSHQGVPDPRLVENRSTHMPFQLPGAQLCKDVLHVLDPFTPLEEIADQFGAARKDALPLRNRAPSIEPQPQRAPPPSLAATCNKASSIADAAEGSAASVAGATAPQETKAQPQQRQQPTTPPAWTALVAAAAAGSLRDSIVRNTPAAPSSAGDTAAAAALPLADSVSSVSACADAEPTSGDGSNASGSGSDEPEPACLASGSTPRRLCTEAEEAAAGDAAQSDSSDSESSTGRSGCCVARHGSCAAALEISEGWGACGDAAMGSVACGTEVVCLELAPLSPRGTSVEQRPGIIV